MIPDRGDNKTGEAGVPRIRGDDPNAVWLLTIGTPCSPHTRG